MTRFIAIDPSTTVTGWAVFEDESLVAFGNIDVRDADYADRFAVIIDTLTSLSLQYGFRGVAIEDVAFAWHSKNRNRNIAGLQVVFRSIQEWAKLWKWPLDAYNPATWKRSVVEFSHASKAKTKENLRFRFPGLPAKLTEHEADAIGIGVYHAGKLKLQAMAQGRGIN